MKYLFLFVFYSAAALAGQSTLVGQLTNSPLRSQACLLTLNNGEGLCSGVRISEHLVLTAQHCVRGRKEARNNIELSCNETRLDVDSVIESERFLKGYKQNEISSEVDFALLVIKNSNNFTPKFKLLKNFDEYKSLLLNSGNGTSTFAENTRCEFMGYGRDKSDHLGKLNSTFIYTTTDYLGKPFFMKVLSAQSGQYIESPLLPDRDANWIYPSARPGDSGGPLFCQLKTGEWILSGIASTWTQKTCGSDESKKTKKSCSSNVWGLPTIEQLESVFKRPIDL